MRWVARVLEETRNRPAAELWARHMHAHLKARLGDFTSALAEMQSWRAQMRELGQEARYFQTADCTWDVCWLAEEWTTGEDALRERVAFDERKGSTATKSGIAAYLADALLHQGKLDEAERYCQLSEDTRATDDPIDEAGWRRVKGRLLAARGELAEAVALSRQAVELIAQSDMLDEHAIAQLDLAEVLRTAGDLEGARVAIRAAKGLFERKGNLVGRARAEALRASL